jgi:hypothetical protein
MSVHLSELRIAPSFSSHSATACIAESSFGAGQISQARACPILVHAPSGYDGKFSRHLAGAAVRLSVPLQVASAQKHPIEILASPRLGVSYITARESGPTCQA